MFWENLVFAISVHTYIQCIPNINVFVETCAPPLPQVSHPQLSHRDVLIDMLHKTRVLTIGKLLSHLKGAITALGQVCMYYSTLL